jgi:hypothetical protein
MVRNFNNNILTENDKKWYSSILEYCNTVRWEGEQWPPNAWRFFFTCCASHFPSAWWDKLLETDCTVEGQGFDCSTSNTHQLKYLYSSINYSYCIVLLCVRANGIKKSGSVGAQPSHLQLLNFFSICGFVLGPPSSKQSTKESYELNTASSP